MTDKQEKILKSFEELLPQLDEIGKATFLAYGEGMVAQKHNAARVQKKLDDDKKTA